MEKQVVQKMDSSYTGFHRMGNGHTSSLESKSEKLKVHLKIFVLKFLKIT